MRGSDQNYICSLSRAYKQLTVVGAADTHRRDRVEDLCLDGIAGLVLPSSVAACATFSSCWWSDLDRDYVLLVQPLLRASSKRLMDVKMGRLEPMSKLRDTLAMQRASRMVNGKDL